MKNLDSKRPLFITVERDGTLAEKAAAKTLDAALVKLVADYGYASVLRGIARMSDQANSETTRVQFTPGGFQQQEKRTKRTPEVAHPKTNVDFKIGDRVSYWQGVARRTAEVEGVYTTHLIVRIKEESRMEDRVLWFKDAERIELKRL